MLLILGIAISMILITIQIYPQSSALFLIIGIPLLVCVTMYLNIIAKKIKLYYKHIFVQEPLNKNFDDVVYIWKSGFREFEVSCFDICAMGDNFSSEDYIKASYHGIPFEMAEVKVVETHNGNHSSIHFHGRMVVFELPNEIVKSVRIYSNNFKHRYDGISLNQNNKIDMEKTSFNTKFDVYSNDMHDAFYLLTPHFMEKIENLYPKYDSIAIHAKGKKIIVAFNDPNNDAFDFKIWKMDTSYYDEIVKIQREINDIKGIVKTLENFILLKK